MSTLLLEPYREVTTESVLVDLEADAQKHIGLWVDMNNGPERKYVKDKAALGKALIKKLDRSRIDQSAAHKLMLDTEAETIRIRLENIISPYTVLINLHADEQKVIRDKAKAKQDAIDLAFEIERDHEFALLIDDKVMQDKADAVKAQKEYDQAIASEAADNAREEIKRQIEYNANAKSEAEARRRADRDHVGNVRKSAKEALMMYANLSEEDARSVVLAITNDLIKNITIKY